MGFGLVGPVLPYLVGRWVIDTGQLALMVSLLSVSYALCAFIAAPLLGALSDRYGRRPVLLVSLLGSAVGYALFGIGGALWVLFLGRIMDGLTAGNFSALFGMLGDSTAPEERGQYFGWIGAAAGGGFILGPAIGGLASKISLETPFFIAAGLTILNSLWGYFFVPESLKPQNRSFERQWGQLNPFTQIAGLFEITALRWLLVAGVLFMIPFAMMQTTLAVLLKDSLNWGADQTSLVFIVVGISDIAVQGLLLALLLKTFGERRVAIGALLIAVCGLVGMALLPVIPNAVLVFSSVIAFAVGEGVFTATLGSLLSQSAGPTMQGRVQGSNQALQSLTQVGGPLLGGSLYSRISSGAPFWAGAGMVLIGAVALLTGGASSSIAPDVLEVNLNLEVN